MHSDLELSVDLRYQVVQKAVTKLYHRLEK